MDRPPDVRWARSGGCPVAIAPPLDSGAAPPAALRERAASDGYLYFRGLLPPGDVGRLRGVVLDACRAHGWLDERRSPDDAVVRNGLRLGAPDDPRWLALLPEIHGHSLFAALAAAEPVRAALGAVFGAAAARVHGDVCRLVSPGTADLTTAPHQDASYLGRVPGVWTAWIPLGDCPVALGPLAVLPGSHARGLLPHTGGAAGSGVGARFDGEVWAAGDLAAGDVLMFAGLTLHRALDNATPDRLRISVDYRYAPAAAAAPDADPESGGAAAGAVDPARAKV
jgi:hypothetical protein